MFWLGLIIKYGLPIAIKLGWVNDAEAAAVFAWYWAKKNITIGANPDDPNPFPGEIHKDGV